MVLGPLLAKAQAKPSLRNHISDRQCKDKFCASNGVQTDELSKTWISLHIHQKKKKAENFSLFPLWKFLSYHVKEWPSSEHLQIWLRPQTNIPFAAI